MAGGKERPQQIGSQKITPEISSHADPLSSVLSSRTLVHIDALVQSTKAKSRVVVIEEAVRAYETFLSYGRSGDRVIFQRNGQPATNISIEAIVPPVALPPAPSSPKETSKQGSQPLPSEQFGK